MAVSYECNATMSQKPPHACVKVDTHGTSQDDCSEKIPLSNDANLISIALL